MKEIRHHVVAHSTYVCRYSHSFIVCFSFRLVTYLHRKLLICRCRRRRLRRHCRRYRGSGTVCRIDNWESVRFFVVVAVHVNPFQCLCISVCVENRNSMPWGRVGQHSRRLVPVESRNRTKKNGKK